MSQLYTVPLSRMGRILSASIIMVFLGLSEVISQTNGTCLIIPSTECEIVVDGESKGTIMGNSPLKVELIPGDHYIQAKRAGSGPNSIKNEVVVIEAGIQKIVKIAFEENSGESPGMMRGSPSEIVVADLNFTLTGVLTVSTQETKLDSQLEDDPDNTTYFYGFDAGDEIVLDFSMTNNKGANKIAVSTFPGGSILYSNKSFQTLENIRIKVPQKTAVKFSMATLATFDRNCKLTIKRVPSPNSPPNFNPNVTWETKFDTTYESSVEKVTLRIDTLFSNVMDKSFNVSANASKGYAEFQLPQETEWWVFWIGVGQESTQQLNRFGESLPNLAKLAGSTNPLVYLGLGLVSEIPKMSGNDDISYSITDRTNRQYWMANYESIYYPSLPHGTKTISEYAVISKKNTPRVEGGWLNATFYNDNYFYATQVNLKIIAFYTKPQTEDRIVKRPVVKKYFVAHFG